MKDNLLLFARNALDFRLSDIRLVLERFRNHLVSPRMSGPELSDVVHRLGFASVEEFGAEIGLEPALVQSWVRYGLSHDAAQLLLALLQYQLRLKTAMTDFEKMTQIPLDVFFDEHAVPIGTKGEPPQR